MSNQRADFKVTAFALLVRRNQGDKVELLVKVPPDEDQPKLKKEAKVPADSQVKIVDLIGVTIFDTDPPIVRTLQPVVEKELGCEITIIGNPILRELTDTTGLSSERDLAIGYPMKLIGNPLNTSQYKWLTYAVLKSDQVVHFAGRGKESRRYLLAKQCLELYSRSPVKKAAHKTGELAVN